jgi:hypothetical protein
MKKKPRGSKKAKVDLKTRHDSMDSYKYDQKGSHLLKADVDDGKPSRADTELKRLKTGDVWRSHNQTVGQMSSNKRRYK